VGAIRKVISVGAIRKVISVGAIRKVISVGAIRKVISVGAEYSKVNFEPTFSCINTLTIRKPSYYSSYLPAYEDETDRMFRNVGIQNSDAGELPRRNYTALKRITPKNLS
jgi:hypothetical protein